MNATTTNLTRIGALAWVTGAVQFFAVQLIVQSGWDTPYRWSTYNISDLGNVACGRWDVSRPRYVCSPLHDLMNISFALHGLLLLVGIALFGTACWGRGRAGRTAGALCAASAAGWFLAGFYPADVNEDLHVLGAAMIMILGNLGLLCSACAPRGRALALGLGAAATAAAALFFTQHDPLGLGLGLLERVAAYGLPLWTCVLGLRLLRGARSGATRTPPCDAR